MTGLEPRDEQSVQAVRAIYAWTLLLQRAVVDEGERARAREVIQRNGQLQLGRIVSPPS